MKMLTPERARFFRVSWSRSFERLCILGLTLIADCSLMVVFVVVVFSKYL